MAEQWYYARKGKQGGPVAFEELKELAAVGTVEPDDMVWQEGMADWTAANKVEGLLPPKKPGPPPMPTTVRPSVGSPTDRKLRIILVVAASATTVSFFTPQFILSISSRYTRVAMGWDSWFGILLFILSIPALAAAIVDITPLVNLHTMIRAVLRFVHAGFAALLALFAVVGLILGLCSVGFGLFSITSYGRLPIRGVSSIPVGFLLLFLSVTVQMAIATILLIKKQ